MRCAPVSVGFIPLVDAAPLIVADALGFAAEEGLSLELRRAPSWSALRDLVCFGRVEAAHLLSPIPVAHALGLGGCNVPLDAVCVLSANGNVIGVSPRLAEALRAKGHDFAFDDAATAGRALIRAALQDGAPLRVGVPFPFSMHAELVYYWLSALGLPSPQSLDVRTIPPQMMPQAIDAGTIDAFCVGEPWGSRAVTAGVAELLLPGSAIWAFAPEKVLAMRSDRAEADPDLRDRLIRSVWRAGRWLSDPASHSVAAELLSRSDHLDLPPEIIDRALSGHLMISPDGEERCVPRFLEFHAGVANFPWRSQAGWMARSLAERYGRDVAQSVDLAQARYRSDIFRSAMATTRADLPSASARIEGALAVDTPAASARGQLILCRDAFFDGTHFDPALI